MPRPTFPANRSRQFGRRPGGSVALDRPAATAADDVRLFLLTFAGGFLFMSVYLA